MANGNKSSGSGNHSRKTCGTWCWGERARTRIAELRTLCEVIAKQAPNTPNTQALATDAQKYLARAEQALDQRWARWRQRGATIDTTETSINAAVCLMLRYMPLGLLTGRLPELLATIREHLSAQDPRRQAVEKFVGESPAKSTLTEQDRETLVTTVRAALSAQEREYIRVRSFRNIVFGVAVVLSLLAIAIAVLMMGKPGDNSRYLPLCFQPADDQVVCPTQSQVNIPTVEGKKTDPDTYFQNLSRDYDYVIIELVGLIAAALAAATTLRRLRGTAVPYSVPLALALLKLPTGALTAVLGLVLMRGEFIPGLSALDSSAQIIAWAVIFGYAQQLFTRLVDERGQAVLNAVGGSENHLTLDQRLPLA